MDGWKAKPTPSLVFFMAGAGCVVPAMKLPIPKDGSPLEPGGASAGPVSASIFRVLIPDKCSVLHGLKLRKCKLAQLLSVVQPTGSLWGVAGPAAVVHLRRGLPFD